jgi:predicted phage baseplate assembly protein
VSAPWWTREGRRAGTARFLPGGDPARPVPELVPSTPRPILRALGSRIAGFTPEWTRRTDDDAGVALIRLFGSQLQPLLERLDRLPEKAFVEHLRRAGVTGRPATAARVMLQLEAARGAPRSVLVPRGFQVGAAPADGSEGLAVFETESDLYVLPGEIAEVWVQEGRSFREVEEPAGPAPFRPFGDRPIAGRALLVGIASAVVPGPVCSLGIGVAAPPGAPPPASAGGLVPVPPPAAAVLRWEVFDGGAFDPAEVIADGTRSFQRSGVVELRVPRGWRSGRPAGLDGEDALYWLRLRLVHGTLAEPPSLSTLRLNVVPALAAETVQGEVLEHVPGRERVMRLRRTPVLPGSLVLEVFEGGASGDLFDLPEEDPAAVGAVAENGGAEAAAGAGGDARRWREVSDLSAYGPADRVYTLDAATGEVTFGDGLHGAAVPPGFRNVRAVAYRVGGGRAGAVAADEVKTLLHSAPFLIRASNPLPASGGADAEPRTETLLRGPEEIRARERAVTERDYELLALAAPGAEAARAHAVSGLHPALGGLPIPGVVGVFVVPPDRGEGPPTADEATLAAVADHLARRAAPAGVEVVAAPVRYHRVRAELRVVLADPSADVGRVLRRVLDALDDYFHPLTGGEEGRGWPFGGAVRHVPLLRRVLIRVPEVGAIPSLVLVVDGVRHPTCTDVAISAHGLLWPDGHEVVPETAEEAS